ncbi:ABC transporter permease [Paenibacillus sp. IB182496]|uniref:ABC transporter permease n=1 Tax=Paenibacillus sabuli TaxID=2772509 RepID=A0A927BTF9_9BACL|nr:ABC transporter permease [Paenibacillus sabuli]MBD2846477.1 ABC transporter permease [Paenibacillus sabuli]
MTFRRFAFNNVMRNKRMYAAYFLSSAFAVMVFFVYAIFAFHPALGGDALRSEVATGLHFAEGIIYVFSFFFVLYSMSAFLKRRKKEFGLLMLHGMTSLQLRMMVFLENVIIGVLATLAGIGLGLIGAKGILLGAENMLGLEETLAFYLPVYAIGLTLAAFVVLFVVISLLTVVILRSSRLIDLLKGGSRPRPEPRASKLLSVLAALLLMVGYSVALSVKGMAVVAALIPVTLVVIVGTYFLFTQLSVFLIGAAKRNRPFFWRRTNLLLFSDLAYRMKDNARTFFMVAIVSTVAFSAIGTLVGFKAMFTGQLVESNPFAYSLRVYEGEDPTGRQVARQLDYMQEVLEREGIAYDRYAIALPSFNTEQGQLTVVRASDYNAMARAAGQTQVEPEGDNVAVVLPVSDTMQEIRAPRSSFTLEDGSRLQVQRVVTSSAVSYFEAYAVAADDWTGWSREPIRTQYYYVYDTPEHRGSAAAGAAMRAYWEEHSDGDTYLFAQAYQLQQMNQGYGAVLFVGLFIGAVFFVASGSFLYFRLYTDLDEDKAKFTAIRKLGLEDRELSRVLTWQLVLLFFLPIGVALVHGAVALTSLQRMFNYSLVRESALVLGAFFLVQTLYFVLIRWRYIRQVREEMRA